MALQKVRDNIESMFDKNLKDLIRGIRNNKNNEAKYIAYCIEEIKQELQQENIAIKANAVAKLTYLQMLGYNISWAAFNIIEVTSSSKFTYKRIGYLSSSQSFHSDTELLMLTTNMIRKDLSSHNQYESGLALSGLSCFISPDLAKDLVTDIMILLTSTKPYLRKKAVLMMYKVFLRFPETLRPAFPRLKEKLEDPDSGVQSAAVNVVCELACKNPRNYLSLAPILFRVMTTSTNNWMLIKIIKLFGVLTPLEPRLGKKFIEPLTNLIHSTSAMSLLYECINTVIAVLVSISSEMPTHTASLQLCIQKLRILIEDSDQNLKYLGLLAISKILKTHPKTVQAHKDLIMQCLYDKDESIRLRALDLVYGMVSKKNLVEIVKKLMSNVEKAEGNSYRSRVLIKIIQICSQDNYQYITNFEWYVSVLVELSHMEGNEHGSLVASQMLDVAVRVQAVRQFAVQQMALLIDNASLLTAQSSSITHVLYAAAWITGEFSEYLINPQSTLEAMLRRQIFHLPGHIKAVYIQNILKLLVTILTKVEQKHQIDRITKLCETVAENLSHFVLNADLEVQERASSALQLVKYLQKEVNRGKFGLVAEMAALFVGELNPVAPKAQKKVQVPEGLDLNVWINDPLPESLQKEMPFSSVDGGSTILFHKYDSLDDQTYNFNNRIKKLELSEEELEKRRQARKIEKENNPHYLKENDHKISRTNNCVGVPVVDTELPISLKIPGLASSESYLNSDRSDKKREKKKNRQQKGIKNKVGMIEEEDYVVPLYMVNRDIGEMPEGAQVSDGEESDEPHKALDINLDEALHDNEKLFVLTDQTLKSPLASLGRSGNKTKRCRHHKAKPYSEDKEKCKSMLTESQSNKSRKDSAENIDLWFGNNSSDYNVIPNRSRKQTCVANIAEQNISRKSKKTKEKKKKKTKANKEKELKENGNKKEKKLKENKKKTKHLEYKEGYEEATGISTLSKEIVEDSLQSNSEINDLHEMVQSSSSCNVTLAKDENLQLMHKIRLSPDESDNIVVTIKLTNQTSSLIKELEFNICNTPVVSLLEADKDSRDCIKLQFQLPAQSCNEAKFVFHVTDVTFPHKVRGTVTYMVQTSNGSLCQKKLDFWFNFPCSTFMIGRMPYHNTLSDLFSNGQLTKHKSMLLEVSKEFSQILAHLCSDCHFLLVEQIGKTASLYSRSIQNHHICLLIKHTNDSGDSKISLEGKSNCDTILINIFSEIEMLLHPSMA